jgi:hypothetical protein
MSNPLYFNPAPAAVQGLRNNYLPMGYSVIVRRNRASAVAKNTQPMARKGTT